MDAKPAVRSYTAAEVLAGWRNYARAGTDLHAPGKNYLARALLLKPGKSEGGLGFNVGMAMWLRVEAFFIAHIECHSGKALMMAGQECDALRRFESWYECFPLPKSWGTTTGHGGTKPYLDSVYFPIRMAIDRWNEDNPRRTRTTKAAHQAIRAGRLVGCKPKGEPWHIRESDIRTWLDSEPRDAG